ATADVGAQDHDGAPALVIAPTDQYSGSGRIYAVHGDGNAPAGGPFLPGWPVRNTVTADVLPVVGSGIPNSPALADVDGDGKLEVALVGIAGVPYIYRGNGTRMTTMHNAQFGPGADANDAPMLVLIANPTFADLDNDGQVDLIVPSAGFRAAQAFASGGQRSDFQHQVAAWNARSGDFLPNFPRRIDDWQFFMNPIVADLDGD